jgi:hypothetical protein
MTAPLAALPPMAPMAAPFAAPLAFGWELCSVCVGGVDVGGVDVGGGDVCVGGVGAGVVCAVAAGTTAPQSPIRRDTTHAECFIRASFLVHILDPYPFRAEPLLLLVIICTVLWFFL